MKERPKFIADALKMNLDTLNLITASLGSLVRVAVKLHASRLQAKMFAKPHKVIPTKVKLSGFVVKSLPNCDHGIKGISSHNGSDWN